jgi:hypothetical protein
MWNWNCKALGEISPKEFAQSIGKQMRLSKIEYAPHEKRVVGLAEAAEDIEPARDFYDAQEFGIGDDCADSLVADIESLRSTTEFTRVSSDFIGCSSIGSRSGFMIVKPKLNPRCSPCRTCAAIQIGFAKS